MIHNDVASGLRASILRVGALPMQSGVAAVLRDFDTDQVGLSHGLPLVAARMALPQGSAANMGTVSCHFVGGDGKPVVFGRVNDAVSVQKAVAGTLVTTQVTLSTAKRGTICACHRLSVLLQALFSGSEGLRSLAAPGSATYAICHLP